MLWTKTLTATSGSRAIRLMYARPVSVKTPPVLGGELPAHPFLEHDPVDARLQRAELEGPFARVNGIVAVAKAAFVLVAEQRQRLGVIGRHVDLPPGPVFPQPDGKGLADARLQ